MARKLNTFLGAPSHPSPLSAIATRWRLSADRARTESRGAPGSEVVIARARAAVYDACAAEIEDVVQLLEDDEA